MARIPYLDAEDLKPEDRDLLITLREGMNALKRPIGLHRALVNSPAAARAFGGLGQFIRYGSRLDPRLRELAILQVGWLARSPYEWSHHVKLGLGFGVTEVDIHGLIADTAGQPNTLDATARCVLAMAREITETGGLSDAAYAALAAVFDAELVTDLVLTISFYNAVVRVLASLAIDVEDEYQPYLEKFPLPG